MRAPSWVVAAMVVGVSGGALADEKKALKEPEPFAVDVNPNKEPVLVLKDANGATYVLVGPGHSKKAFYGTGKKLYEQVSAGGSANGDAWAVNIWAPRIPEMRPGAIMRRDDGTYFRSCSGLDDAMLTELTGDKAKAVLDKSAFLSPALVRRAHLLARDDMGIYYYVDKLAERYGGKSYRVFVGKRGAMKQLPLVDIAMDSAGEVFSTKTGDLRLVVDTTASTGQQPKRSSWVKGAKKSELFTLDASVNSVLIFKELGIYKLFGGICDNV